MSTDTDTDTWKLSSTDTDTDTWNFRSTDTDTYTDTDTWIHCMLDNFCPYSNILFWLVFIFSSIYL